MRMRTLIGFLSLALMLPLGGTAAEQTYIVFDAPNATGTQPTSINANGEITGYFSELQFIEDNIRCTPCRGFVRNVQGIITVFDAPNASTTFPSSINERGQIAGQFFRCKPKQSASGLRARIMVSSQFLTHQTPRARGVTS